MIFGTRLMNVYCFQTFPLANTLVNSTVIVLMVSLFVIVNIM